MLQIKQQQQLSFGMSQTASKWKLLFKQKIKIIPSPVVEPKQKQKQSNSNPENQKLNQQNQESPEITQQQKQIHRNCFLQTKKDIQFQKNNSEIKSQQNKGKQVNSQGVSQKFKKIFQRIESKQIKQKQQSKQQVVNQKIKNQKDFEKQIQEKQQNLNQIQKQPKNKCKGAKGHYKIYNPEHFQIKQEVQIKTSIHRWQYGSGQTPQKLLISSWNLNGIRARTIANDIMPYLQSAKPDIFCVNQHKMDQKSYLQNPIKFWGYYSYWNFPKYSLGYSGVAIFSKYSAKSMFQDIHVPQHSKQGRVITLQFEKFILINVYIPTSGRQLERLKYRVQEYDPAFRQYILKVRQKYPEKMLIICGDINVAHKQLDCHVGKRMKLGKQPAFTYQERSSFNTLLKDANLLDTFRYFHPNVRQYTWWSMRRGGRQRAGQTGIGKRLDYFLVNKDSLGYVQSSQAKKDVKGCDHCPIQLKIDFT